MTPSPYQQRIYDWIQAGSGSLLVEAVAGSGKTTTLTGIARLIPKGESARFFAFNRSIAEVLKGRLIGARNVLVSTFHSAGYQAIQAHLSAKIATEKWKMKDLLKLALGDSDRRQYGEPLLRLVSLAKGQALRPGEDGLEPWQQIIDHHDLDFEYLVPPGNHSGEKFDRLLQEEKDRVLMLAWELLDASNKAAGERFDWKIDFDDQLYLPILWDLPLPRYDWVLVDELQDTNYVQREFLQRSLKPGGRLIGVGDRHQAIYGWRGAGHDAMDLIQVEFQATELPLSICYRCAARIVEMAQELVPQIEAAPAAPVGSVYLQQPPALVNTLGPEDAILCRNNASLVSQAYSLIKQGVPCQILGRDIGDGLKKLIWRLRPQTVEELETRLEEYRQRETLRYRRLKQESKASGVEDRCACLTTIIESLDREERSLPAIEEAIDGLFGDGSKALLTLSTIHKAKGQEWRRVALMRPDLLPSFWAKQGWQLQQERNLQYVAYTRAKEELWILDDKPEWLRKKERGSVQPDENEVGMQVGRWDRK